MKQEIQSQDFGPVNGAEVKNVPEMAKCPGCGASFESREKLIDHVVETHEANCQICGAKTRTREELVKHNKEIHGI